MTFSSLSILIPAAGTSKRLGQAKQLVDYNGISLLQRAVNTALSISPLEIIVVTGAHAKAVRDSVQGQSVTWVHNRRWPEGMGTSIAMGATAINPESNGLMVFLCDQWRVQTQDLRGLAECWRSHPDGLVAATWGGQSMPPVIFPSSCFKQMQMLSGRQGAKTLIKDHAENVMEVSMENAAYDLDSPADLTKFKNYLGGLAS